MFNRFLFIAGAGLLTISMIGKSSIYFYRAIKAGNAFAGPRMVGSYYKGGFEKTMTSREASLILGVR